MDRGCRYFEFYQKLGYYFVYGHTLATDGLSSPLMTIPFIYTKTNEGLE